MINLLNQFIGRTYQVIEYQDGVPISGVAGWDMEWIASALIYIIMVYFVIKLVCRIFIGK